MLRHPLSVGRSRRSCWAEVRVDRALLLGPHRQLSVNVPIVQHGRYFFELSLQCMNHHRIPAHSLVCEWVRLLDLLPGDHDPARSGAVPSSMRVTSSKVLAATTCDQLTGIATKSIWAAQPSHHHVGHVQSKSHSLKRQWKAAPLRLFCSRCRPPIRVVGREPTYPLVSKSHLQSVRLRIRRPVASHHIVTSAYLACHPSLLVPWCMYRNDLDPLIDDQRPDQPSAAGVQTRNPHEPKCSHSRILQFPGTRPLESSGPSAAAPRTLPLPMTATHPSLSCNPPSEPSCSVHVCGVFDVWRVHTCHSWSCTPDRRANI